MTTQEKYFVFINPAPSRIRKLLNLAIFALSPTEKWPAHITVAGPFNRRPRSRAHPEFDRTVFVLGVWNFFSIGFGTVYLKVGMPGIEKYWSKPDFVGNPVTHVSIYNGRDFEFANAIFNRLKPINPSFSFPVKGIDIIRSSSQGTTALREEVDISCLEETLGLSIEEVASLSKFERIEIAAKALEECNSVAGEQGHGMTPLIPSVSFLKKKWPQ